MNQPYTLTDAVQAAIEQRLADMHTCLPASVEKYDGAKRQADVKPLIKRRFTDGTVLDMPVITNVPVVFLGSSDTTIHFPIKKGDTVLVVFAERSLDGWLSSGGNVDPRDTHKFALSDAIAIPGLFPFSVSNPANTNPDDLVLNHKGQTIVVKASGEIELGGLGGLIQKLVTESFLSIVYKNHVHPVSGANTLPPTPIPDPMGLTTTSKVQAQ